ncbi:ABC transporter ATP-binding protein [Parafannyhessea umbonata]|uniref:ATP-binding cassette, subfamily B n=1 Tax=Parafannyhessea umbonata TaxID=604330 RepID=A0A1H9N3Q6_9ACTN|nr:ABC transporter ATP-binding protein [Parafannyhessea umbonata]SER30319.1 ATP-binding cassette, subfamily B [Parafannyhessea umbonata]
MFGEKFKRKFALTDQGVRNARLGAYWTVAANLTSFAGIGFLFLFVKQLTDAMTTGAELPGVLPYVLGLLAYFALSFLVHRMQYQNTYGTVYEEVGTLRKGLAERMRKLPLSFFMGRDLADLSETIMSDVKTLEHVWSHVLGYLYGSYIFTAVVAVVLLTYDWRLAIAALWSVPVAFALLFGSRKMTVKSQAEAKAAALGVSEDVQETLDNVREIRAINQEERYLSGLFAAMDKAEASQTMVELGNGIVINAASVIMRLGIATTIMVGANLIVAGQIDFMVFFAFLLCVSRIYSPFDQSLALIAEVFFSEVSAKRLQAIYDEPTAGGAESFSPKGHDIVFDNVGFSYDGAPVLRGASFVAREGEVTALVGPSGSGKTTCSRLAARLWDADSGSVRVGGVDVSTVDPEVLLGDYAMVFQDVILFDDTVMGNIRLGRRDATDEEVLAAAKAANCDEFVRDLPQGYDTMIGENGSRLSGGERQRISIARALLKDAPILLMDEATASLDVESETQVQEALSRLLVGKTVLVIAHRMRTIENADKVVVLEDGRVAEEGRPSDLLQQGSGFFRHVTELQTLSAGWSI